jgi:hypothetical protein
MPRIDRDLIIKRLQQKIARIPAARLLPMPHRLDRGGISFAEREEYQLRRAAYLAASPGYDAATFTRPSRRVVDGAWRLLRRAISRREWPIEERTGLVILAALFARAAQEKRNVSYNDAFDALCRAFSDHAARSPAAVVRDMRPLSAKRAHRDLLINGIYVTRLWQFMVKTWPAQRKHPCFYRIERIKTGTAHHIVVKLRPGRRAAAFCDFLKRERVGLSPPRGIRLCFIEEEDAKRGRGRKSRSAALPATGEADAESRTACRFCAEVPYNVIKLGDRSREMLTIQSQARLLFDTDTFKRDYRQAQKNLKSLSRSLRGGYGVDPDQSDLPRRMDLTSRPRGRKALKGPRQKDVEYWSPRDETLYYRSIERALRAGSAARDKKVKEMADEKRLRNPDHWVGRRDRFAKWVRRNGNRALARATAKQVCEAAVAGWHWRKRVRAKLAAYDRALQVVLTYRAVYEQVENESGVKQIRSDFARVINRRYQPLHMWPAYVSAKPLAAPDVKQASRGVDEPDADAEERDPEAADIRSYRKRWFKALDPVGPDACELTNRDISSSQTQIVATLLGIKELEQRTMASGTKVPFKKWLADLAFREHRKGEKEQARRQASEQEAEQAGGASKAGSARRKRAAAAAARSASKRSPSGRGKPNDRKGSKPRRPKHIFSLRTDRRAARRKDDYVGGSDSRLQNLCKMLWMTASYGSDLRKVHELQTNDPVTFGPGWTIKDAGWFLRKVNKRFPEMQTFLRACRYIANRACKRRPSAGIELIDPSDMSVIRWNPVARKEQPLSSHDGKIILSLPAVKRVTDTFPLSREYPVDRERLRRMMAPCIVHTIDAYFSTLVMRKLADRKIRDFIGIHDCWYVPKQVRSNGRVCDGDRILRRAINDAAAEWYRGLGPVYRSLLANVRGQKEFERLIKRAQRRWWKRRREGHVPRFLSKAD